MRRFALFLIVLSLSVPVVPVQAQFGLGSGLAQLQQFSDGLAELAAQVKPGVVAVKTEIVLRVGMAPSNPFAGTPFEDFFGNRYPFFRMPEGEEHQQGLGSGVIVSQDGYILTNNHVITASDRQTVADKIAVELLDKRTFEAKVVGRDPLSDLAVLKIEARGLPTLSYGDSDQLRVGEVVMAVGNPFGQLHTVTIGIVSALGRGYMGLAEYEDFIQTDAAINPGNSGGALVNARGQLIGINTAIIGAGSRFEGNIGNAGVGFAIPINMARNIMEQLVERGEVRRGQLGVMIQPVTKEVAAAMKVEEGRGVLVGDVVKDSAAEKAGLKTGDIILELNGEAVNDVNALRNRIAMTAPGTQVRLKVLRDGEERIFTAKLGQREQQPVAFGRQQSQSEALGFQVQELTDEIARQLGYEGEKGVVVSSVASGSEAARRDLRRGDLIQEVNRRPVQSVAEFREALKAGQDKEAVLLLVRRGENTRFVALPLPKK